MHKLKEKIREGVDHLKGKKDSGSINGLLKVTIIEGSKLKKEDILRNEPYIIITLGGTKHQSSVKNGSSPTWNETLNFPLKDVDDKLPIKIECWDKDPGFDDMIGDADLTLADLAKEDRGNHTIQLTHSKKLCGTLLFNFEFDGSGWPAMLRGGGEQFANQGGQRHDIQQRDDFQQRGDRGQKREFGNDFQQGNDFQKRDDFQRDDCGQRGDCGPRSDKADFQKNDFQRGEFQERELGQGVDNLGRGVDNLSLRDRQDGNRNDLQRNDLQQDI